jgi:hypothetical protein
MFYASGNCDRPVFENPDHFDLSRKPNPHLGFGGGSTYYCLQSGRQESVARPVPTNCSPGIPISRPASPRYWPAPSSAESGSWRSPSRRSGTGVQPRISARNVARNRQYPASGTRCRTRHAGNSRPWSPVAVKRRHCDERASASTGGAKAAAQPAVPRPHSR